MRPYIAREWRRCCADPRRFAFLFGAALVYLVLFAVLFAPNIITEVPCVIYDEDQSALSRKLAQKFEDNERFGIIAYAATQEETLALLREKEALAAIVIPKGFAKSIQTGSYTTLLCVANGANLMPIGAATGDGENIAAEFSDEIALRREELRTGRNEAALGNRVVPVRHELRVLNNPTQGYRYFYLLGLLVAALQQGIFFATGAAVCSESTSQEETRPTVRLFLAKAVFYWLLSMAAFSMLLLCIVYALDIPLKAHTGEMFLAGGAFVFATVSLGLAFASFFSDEETFARASIMYPLLGFIVSGYTYPLMAMPPALQNAARLLPQTWFANIFRELFLAGHSPQAGEGMAAMAAVGVFCLLVGCARFSAKGRGREMGHAS